jgi:hypothetical protein
VLCRVPLEFGVRQTRTENLERRLDDASGVDAGYRLKMAARRPPSNSGIGILLAYYCQIEESLISCVTRRCALRHRVRFAQPKLEKAHRTSDSVIRHTMTSTDGATLVGTIFEVRPYLPGA